MPKKNFFAKVRLTVEVEVQFLADPEKLENELEQLAASLAAARVGGECIECEIVELDYGTSPPPDQIPLL